jgi:hemoglobin
MSPAPPRGIRRVAAELGRTLDLVKAPQREEEEVLAAFAAHNDEFSEAYARV